MFLIMIKFMTSSTHYQWDIVEKGEDTLTVEIPTNKADVWREADVIEEILRIYGFNQVPIPQQIRSTISFTAKQDEHRISNNRRYVDIKWICRNYGDVHYIIEAMAPAVQYFGRAIGGLSTIHPICT